MINLPDIFPETLQTSIGICLREYEKYTAGYYFHWAAGATLVWYWFTMVRVHSCWRLWKEMFAGHMMVGHWPLASSCVLNIAIQACESSLLSSAQTSNFASFFSADKQGYVIRWCCQVIGYYARVISNGLQQKVVVCDVQ